MTVYIHVLASPLVLVSHDVMCTAYPHLQAEVMFVAKQRDMLETKVEFRAAQRERGASLRQKTSIETKIAVSCPYIIHCSH